MIKTIRFPLTKKISFIIVDTVKIFSRMNILKGNDKEEYMMPAVRENGH